MIRDLRGGRPRRRARGPPRARRASATVAGRDDGVRALVIGGEGLKAILRERPEAAMAMLATLAERISRQ